MHLARFAVATFRVHVGAWALALALVFGLGGCSSCKRDGETGASAEPVVAAPASLLLEVRAASPDQAWRRVQRGVGGLAMLLPTGAFGMLAVSADLDVSLGDLVDGARPAFLVVGGTAQAPRWVLLATARERRAVENKYPSRGAARFVSPSTVTLERLPIDRAGAQIHLSSRSEIVVSSDERALDELLPYAMFTLQRSEASGHDLSLHVPHAAMAPLAAELRSRWAALKSDLLEKDAEARRAHGGRAPDYGNPQVLLGAGDAMANMLALVLDDIEDLDVSLDARDEGVALSLRAKPGNGPLAEWAKGLGEGDAEALGMEPSSTRMALLDHGDPAQRKTLAHDLGTLVEQVLEARLSNTSRSKLVAAFDAFGEATAPTLHLRLEADPRRLVVLGKREGGALRASASAAMEVLKQEKVLREWLEVRDVLGPRAATGRQTWSIAQPANTYELSVYEQDAGQALMLAPAARIGIGPQEDPWRKGTRPQLTAALRALGPRSSFLAVFGSVREGSSEEPAALVLGLGRREQRLAVDSSTDYRFLRELPQLLVP